MCKCQPLVLDSSFTRGPASLHAPGYRVAVMNFLLHMQRLAPCDCPAGYTDSLCINPIHARCVQL